MSTPNTIPRDKTLRDKTLSVIKEKVSATFSEIKRAINVFNNKAGGAGQLRKYLADMVVDGTLTVGTDINDKGQAVESYSLAKNNACNGRSNHSTGNGNANSNSSNLMTITLTLGIVIEGCPDIAHILTSFLNVDDGNYNECEVEATIDDIEEPNPTIASTVVEPLEYEPEDTSFPSMPAAPIRRAATPPARTDTSARPKQDKTSPSDASQPSRDSEEEEEEDGEIDPDEIPF